MTTDKIYDQPSEIDAVDGKVVMDGPDGVAVLLTPDAAVETSDRLLWGAAKAQGQIVQKEAEKSGTEMRHGGSAGAAPP